MKIFLSKHGKELILGVIILVCFICLINVVAHVQNYTSSLDTQSVEKASFYAYAQKARLNNNVERLYDMAKVIRHSIEVCRDYESMQNAVRAVPDIIGRDNADYVGLCYFHNGQLYDSDFEKYAGYPELLALETAEEDATSNLFQYKDRIMSIGVSVPVESPYMDRLVLIYGRTALSDFMYDDPSQVTESCRYSVFTLFCKHDGVILERVVNRDIFRISTEAVQEGVLRDLITGNSDYKTATQFINTGTSGSLELHIDGVSYVLIVESMGAQSGNVFVLNLFRLSDMYLDGYNLVNLIWGTLCVFFALLVILSIYLLVSQLSMHRKIFDLSTINKQLNCPTLVKFERDAGEILTANKATRFAIIIARFKNFSYINERFGEDMSLAVLKYGNNIIKGSLSLSETYAYGSDGEFYLLFHYREQKTLVDRLNGLCQRVAKFPDFDDKNYKLDMVMDVYEIERDVNQSVQMMLNKVVTVRNMAINNAGAKNITFYTEISRDTYLKKAEIEGTMEQALRDAEFHIFYQPKFNFERKTVDGSEILVRWFDAKNDRYRQPDVFLPIFEENGFIVKMDHFVFFKACENVIYCQNNGVPVYPISVNVSRVTVMQQDFVEYYTRIKQKFNIPNGFVTLEFTESFAYENYEYLATMVDQLHRAGFICSLDDFGTGYSSYNILKTLDMDEIKLDRFFIGKGLSDERDRVILDGVIKMIKNLGMKVTQEGVETKEDYEKLHKLGCDTIQGYYFAKPMKFVHYCEFVATNFPK